MSMMQRGLVIVYFKSNSFALFLKQSSLLIQEIKNAKHHQLVSQESSIANVWALWIQIRELVFPLTGAYLLSNLLSLTGVILFH